MYCKKCGKELLDDARFCGFCGSSVLPQKPICPMCGRELDSQMAFCCYCGAKLDFGTSSSVQQAVSGYQIPSQPQPASGYQIPPRPQPYPSYQAFPQPQTADTQSGQLAMVRAGWYPNDSPNGYIEADGELSVYRNRIEFRKTLVHGVADMFGLVGMAVSASKAKNSSLLSFPMDQIVSAQEARYGTYPSLVLRIKNGEIHTFIMRIKTKEAFTGSAESVQKFQECIRIIQSNLS